MKFGKIVLEVIMHLLMGIFDMTSYFDSLKMAAMTAHHSLLHIQLTSRARVVF